MMGYLVGLAQQFFEIMASMSAARRIAILLFMGLVISSLVGLMIWSSRPEYQVLFSGLVQDDATVVIAKLRERQIPYIIDGGGSVIKVPSGVVHEMRLSLAEENVPAGGGLGFEIFDRSSLGVTDFVQKVNFLRALQGELARTISKLRTVSSARIHIVMPDRSLFAEGKREPSASVVVGLAGVSSLPKGQVNSIVHLVASAVEGLDSKNVTVVDSRGNTLAGGQGDEESDLISATQQEFEANLERRMERKIESMLAKVVGLGKAVARVDLDLNLKRVERTREVYDPEKQIERSIRRVKESNQTGAGGGGGGGVPGVQANVPESERNKNAGGAGSSSRKSSRVSETINYEIDKTIERVVEPVGEIRRISAAVMVDGTYSGAGGGAAPKFQARTQAEIDSFTELVSGALGLNTKRGDTVKIVSVPFKQPAAPAEADGIVPAGQQAFILDIVKYAIGIVALFLIFLFVLRPILKWISSMELRVAPVGELPAGFDGQALPEGMPPNMARRLAAGMAMEPEVIAQPKTDEELKMEESAKIHEQVYEFVTNSPEKSADLLRSWVRESPTV